MRTTISSASASLVIAAALVSACSDPMAPAAAARRAAPPSLDRQSAPEKVRYLVIFKRDVDDVPGRARALAAKHGSEARDIWEHVKGFSVELPEPAAARLAEDPDVAAVSPDTPVSADADLVGPPSWGLDRVDQRSNTLDGRYTFFRTGIGQHVYVMDTGIRASHNQFGGRVTGGANFISDGRSQNTDCKGHGTHVASTIGGATTGIAHLVSLHSVRVLGCDGTSTATSIVAGINWIIAFGMRPAVVNLSLGGAANTALDLAVDGMTAAGFLVVVAAGNDNENACNHSPARAATVMTVGNVTSAGSRWTTSNFGSCVEIWAPGRLIVGADASSTSALTTMTGTSMAAPHVAGAAALLLEQSVFNAPILGALLTANATTGALTGLNTGSPNRLLFTRFIN
jgi:subtilisin family serine protease